MKRAQQLALPGFTRKTKTVHGGSYAGKGKRKVARPLGHKRPVHIVMRSQRARGPWNFRTPRNFAIIHQIVTKQARRHGIKLMKWANAGNHLHFMAKAQSRKHWQAFLISVPALIARKVTGASKGKPIGKFWDGLTFTRVLSSFLEEKTLFGYIGRNELEGRLGRWARELFEARMKEPVWDPYSGKPPPPGRWAEL